MSREVWKVVVKERKAVPGFWGWIKEKGWQGGPGGKEGMAEVRVKVEQLVKRKKAGSAKERIQAWRRRCREKVQAGDLPWDEVREAAQPSPCAVAGGAVGDTLDHSYDAMVREARMVWEGEWTAKGQPNQELIAELGSCMPRCYAGVGEITLEELRRGIDSLREAAASGTDRWAAGELRLLPEPAVEDLLRLLVRAEVEGRWPAAALRAWVVLIHKSTAGALPHPSRMRPIVILPMIYRLWARISPEYPIRYFFKGRVIF